MTTKQQAYDALVARIAAGGPWAIKHEFGGSPACIYDKAQGGGCAIGMWIPDELYRTSIEGTGAGTLFAENQDIAEHFEDHESDFWLHLQRAHDFAAGEDPITSAEELALAKESL